MGLHNRRFHKCTGSIAAQAQPVADHYLRELLTVRVFVKSSTGITFYLCSLSPLQAKHSWPCASLIPIGMLRLDVKTCEGINYIASAVGSVSECCQSERLQTAGLMESAS